MQVLTKTEAARKALTRYTHAGGNLETGNRLLAEIIAEPWCVAQALVHWNFATARTAPALAAALA